MLSSLTQRALAFTIAAGFWPLSSRTVSAQETPNTSGHRWVSPAVTAPRLQHRTFESAAARTTVSYHIYTPEIYDTATARRFPVIYWLHGSGGPVPGPAPFVARLDSAVRAGKVPPVLVVFPNGLVNSMWVDWKDRSVPMETVVIKELIPHVDATFRTIASREGRVIEGFSMGGYGAARLGFKYPDLFGSVSIMGGGPLQEEFKVNEAPRASPAQVQVVLDAVFGGDQEYFKAQSPWRLAEQNAEAVRRLRIRQVVGDRDQVLENNRKLHDRLSRLNIPHAFIVVPGAAHSFRQVVEGLGDRHWEFYRDAFAATATRDDTKVPASPPPAKLPAFAELGDGWRAMEPGGETSCAITRDFRFYARRGDPTRLLLYLTGGGACSTGKDCDPTAEDPPYAYRIGPNREPGRFGGILELRNPKNPFAEYSMVWVPACTGDVHLGDRDVTYTIETPSAAPRQLTIHHRGQKNVGSALDWIHANFPAPREIFVAGSSAGAIGTAFYANRLARHYPQARVVGLGDDAGGGGGQAAAKGMWGIPDVLRRHAGWEDADGTKGVVGIYTKAARGMPNLRLYQFDHAYDWSRRFYRELAGNRTPFAELPALLRANRTAIRAEVPSFRGYTAGGHSHTILVNPRFYLERTRGYLLRDWVAAIAAGDTVPNVECTDCSRPEFAYDSVDLRIAERMIELLSRAGAWESRDDGAACPADATRLTLRCALERATRDVTGAADVVAHSVRWDIAFSIGTVGYRETFAEPPLIAWNNRPNATVREMLSMLGATRERIQKGLGARP